MNKIRVLTVKNPWATLILRGQMTLEVRTWLSKHPGLLGIHVAASDASQKDWSDRERAKLGLWYSALPEGACRSRPALRDGSDPVDKARERACTIHARCGFRRPIKAN